MKTTILKADQLRRLSLEDLAKEGNGPHQYYKVSFEFERRQTQAQIEAAEYAKQSVRWMF